MLDLALCIFFSSLLFVIFRLFTVFKVQTFYAIVVNYLVACTVGILVYSEPLKLPLVYTKSWFSGTVALGLLFITVFNITGRTSQKLGVSVASVASKMSLAIPVLFGIFLFEEQLSSLKIAGIVLALAAVYFASIKEPSHTVGRKALLLPFLLFIGSGLIDAGIKYFQGRHMEADDFSLFSATVFGAAGFYGIVMVLAMWMKTPLQWNIRNVLGGITLGVPNYFTIYFLLRALKFDGLNSASIFTVINVAVVLLSTLLGIVLFKEQLSSTNWVGIILAVVSIILVILF